MLTLATVIAALGVLLVALLAVPVVLVIDAERVDTMSTRWQLRWLFGAIEVRLSGRSRNRTAATSDRPAPPARGGRRPARRARMALAVLRTPGVIGRVVRLATELRRLARFAEFRLRTEFGFESPADTGVAYGLLVPWLVIARNRGLNVHCQPMFLHPGWRGDLHGTIHLRPVTVLGALARFVVSPPVIRAMRSAWQART